MPHLRAATLWIVIGASVAVSCASEWPPHQGEARDHFLKHRAQLENLINVIDQDGFQSMALTDVSPPVLILGGSGPISAPQKEEWAALLRDADVDDVRRDGEDYFFRRHNPLALFDGVVWDGVLVRRDQQVEADRLCASADRSNACGNCQVILADDWYAHYIWSPKDDWQHCLEHDSRGPAVP